jgi:hypothetical protein
VGYASVNTANHSALLDTEIKECAYRSHIDTKSIKHQIQETVHKELRRVIGLRDIQGAYELAQGPTKNIEPREIRHKADCRSKSRKEPKRID